MGISMGHFFFLISHLYVKDQLTVGMLQNVYCYSLGFEYSLMTCAEGLFANLWCLWDELKALGGGI